MRALQGDDFKIALFDGLALRTRGLQVRVLPGAPYMQTNQLDITGLIFSECQKDVGVPGAIQPQGFIELKVTRANVETGRMYAQ